jgi:diguanylate cyclase (GGDEF)-like protein
MKNSEQISEVQFHYPGQIGVIGSAEARSRLSAAIPALGFQELPLELSSGLELATTKNLELIICEAKAPFLSSDFRVGIETQFPNAVLISCACDLGMGIEGDSRRLEEASEQAGYLGHVKIDRVALQLPQFLRYAEERRDSMQQAQQRSQLERLLEASTRMHSSLDQQRVGAEILDSIRSWVDADNWQLYVLSDDRKILELIGAEGVRTRPPSLTLRSDSKGLVQQTLKEGELIVFGAEDFKVFEAGDPDFREAIQADTGISSVMCCPLKVGNQVIGISQATRFINQTEFTESDRIAIQQLSVVAATALNNAVQFARAERLYMQDDLTQLHNSRYLRQYLETEFRRVRRYGGEVAVIFIDLDGFKGVNDRYGHRVGSETLKEMATLLMESVRDTDVVTRYGGDEFTVVLSSTGAERALITAERVRQKVATYEFKGGSQHTFHLTASFGIASYPRYQADSAADLLEKADLAMYEAKAANKNNVKLAKN